MKIIIVSAMSQNGFIGNKNKLMWNLPMDLKRFKQMTIGETIIMGRKTFESIGQILPYRQNIVLTKHKKLKNIKNIKIISNIQHIFKLQCQRIFIIGGGQIYQQTINIADILELTLIHKNFIGDTKFPPINLQQWKKTKYTFYKKDKLHSVDYSFIQYKRI
ncbi:dihydrofolate reductase [Blattabacterium cuenoti]|uniref:dihydrofolate reductase n=1 Tax=Blattabacterium cuenoti TaxID=1653831 RepID=UPI00163CE86A|nr:dihydrofolate reductase [Blattabacterium cuenoti]